jgi:hypothetical protein
MAALIPLNVTTSLVTPGQQRTPLLVGFPICRVPTFQASPASFGA